MRLKRLKFWPYVSKKNALLASLQKVNALPQKVPLVLQEKMSRDDFHMLVSRTLRELFGPFKGQLDIWYHSHRNGKSWHSLLEHSSTEIASTIQIEFLINSSGEALTQIPAQIKQKLEKEIGLGQYRRLLAFNLLGQYDYLMLDKSVNSKIDEPLEVLRSSVELVQRISESRKQPEQLVERINDLESELGRTQRQLDESERSLRKRVYELNNLLEISNELYSTLDLERLLNAALLILIGQIGCMRTFAVLDQPLSGSYGKIFTKGFGKESIEVELEFDHPIIRYFSEVAQPVLVSDLLVEPELEPLARKMLDSHIEMLAPVFYSQRFHGLLGCGVKLDNTPFDKSDLRMFNILQNIISISISNAQMYEHVKKMSFTDAMTKLNNYRYFESRLKEEIQRSRRNKTVVSMIMLDIDNFKNYNDALGHRAGDEALEMVGAILKSTVREDDIVNRYGGEEFAIILPGMGKDSIHILAERIRENVDQASFYKQEVQPGNSLTISLGGATFPVDADNFDDLVKKADKALYNSKTQGRNRFTLYSATCKKMQ